MMKTIIISFAIFFAFHLNLYSQWSPNASLNLQVCDVSGSQELPKISPTSDGGCYIAWFDTRGGSYAVYLQRLNAQGIKQFAADGLLISGNPQSTSLVDWDMITDDSNNAVIVFTDTRNGSSINPFAYRISPSGNFLWGANGVTLSNDFDVFQPNPKIMKTTDNNFVITWVYSSTPNKVALQKLNGAGVKQWGTDPVYLTGGGTENFTYPSLTISDNGSVIAMWSGYSGSFLNPQNYKLYSQKFSSAGTPVWNVTQDTVYSLGRVTGFFVPKIFPDGNNGALYVWQDDRNAANLQSSYVQHFNSDGLNLFPLNGSEASTETGFNKFDAWAAYMTATNETYLFWKQTNSLQSSFAIYGQRFSSNGTRLWTDNAKQFVTFSNNSYINQICFAMDTSVVVAYNESIFGSANNYQFAFRTNRSGNFEWGGTPIDVADILSGKSKIIGTINSNGMTMLAWADNRNDGNGVYAQNVNFDGTLGTTTGIEHSSSAIPEKYSLSQNYPNPFNPVTKIRFSISEDGRRETQDVKLVIYDALGKEVMTLINQALEPGSYEVDFDSRSTKQNNELSSGVYFYSLSTDNFKETKRMVLMK